LEARRASPHSSQERPVSARVGAGVLLVALPVAFNVVFTLLARGFGYPDVLRQPTGVILARFRAGGSRLILLWWAFVVTSLALAPTALLLAGALADAGTTAVLLMAGSGLLSALVQVLGLARWPFLVPFLAQAAAEPDAPAGRTEAVEVVFQAFHRYLGVAVGEHLGYLLTGAWTASVAGAVLAGDTLPAWLGLVGLVLAPLFVVGSLEFVGRTGERGWPVAERIVPVVYVAWSLWLVAVGVTLLL
jgi:hypothetical protein